MENMYKQIIEASLTGYSYYKIINDEEGKPIDYVYVEVNRSFENIIGLSAQDLIGKKGTELRGDSDSQILELIKTKPLEVVQGRQYHIILKGDEKNQPKKMTITFLGNGYFSSEIQRNSDSDMKINIEDSSQDNISNQIEKEDDQYKILFDKAPLGYQSLDENGNLITVNEHWLSMLGYERDEAIGKWIGEFLAPSYLEKLKDKFPKFKEQGYIHTTYEMKHKNGEKLFVTVDGKIGHDSNGGFKQTHCILKDVTKQHELEKALAENRYLTKSLMDYTPVIIYIKNTEGKYQLFNKAAEKLSGKKAENILGKGVSAVFPPRIAEKIMEIDQEVLDKKEIITCEEVVVDASGVYRTFLSTKGPIFNEDKELIGMFGISRDITDRIKREQDLLESERKYRLITENVADVISVFNITKNKYNFMSPSISRLTGYSVDEAISHSAENIIVPELVESFRASMKSQLEEFISNPNTDQTYINEVQALHKDGSRVWVEISTRYKYNEDNDIEALNTTRLIEERKKAEETMRRLSYYDQLSGLYNRRFYEEELKRLDVTRNLPISLIMADLNGLKLTNDAFGHLEGDELLKKVAEVLRRECRTDEIISRIGGDEFVILMPKTNAGDSRRLIKRINQAIKNEVIKHGLLSLSIGFAVKDDMSEHMNDIFKRAEDNMYRHKLADSSSMRSKTINIIMNSLFEKSNREMLHSNRVSEICRSMANVMNFNHEDINQVKLAGLVHDIGKIGISNSILDKKGKLTSDEWLEIKKHCEVGYRILSSVNEFSEISEYVLSHQERWDGKGYPLRLEGEAIPLQSRIIAIADAFDAMTSDRTYRLGMSETDAIKEIKKCSGTQFDPEIVRIFVEEVLPHMKSEVEKINDFE